jgi:hypothetical protein
MSVAGTRRDHFAKRETQEARRFARERKHLSPDLESVLNEQQNPTALLGEMLLQRNLVANPLDALRARGAGPRRGYCLPGVAVGVEFVEISPRDQRAIEYELRR